MSIKNIHRTSLVRYWTTRYVATLLIGLVIVAIVSAIWIRHTTIEHRLNMTIFMAEQIADRIMNQNGESPVPRGEEQDFINQQRLEKSTFIVDTNGNVLSSNRMPGRVPIPIRTLPLFILEDEKQVQNIQLDNQSRNRYYVVKAPIEYNDILFGWVVIMQTEQDVTEVQQEYTLLIFMLVSLAILGWAAVYFLSRKLSTPIKDVAKAAKKIQAGDYQIELPTDLKEQEVYELVYSFKEMANRLQQLEAMRSELLAGVTHELKTPVTSISGLLQALKDDVVTGEDAKEFLAISLKETAKMQKMVEDLLAFNSFAAHSIPISSEEYEINEFIKETIHEWQVVQENDNVVYQLKLLDKNCFVYIDPVRLQQIIVNLLGNAKHAIEGVGTIAISLSKLGDEKVAIDVQDSGKGIPINEQELVFERFYRGGNKKYKVRGLGLGLPFSKMIAHALGGDLRLLESSSNGTTFRITLPIMEK